MPHNQLDNFYCFSRISGMKHCAGSNELRAIRNGAKNSRSINLAENSLIAIVQGIQKETAPVEIARSQLLNSTNGFRADYKMFLTTKSIKGNTGRGWRF